MCDAYPCFRWCGGVKTDAIPKLAQAFGSPLVLGSAYSPWRVYLRSGQHLQVASQDRAGRLHSRLARAKKVKRVRVVDGHERPCMLIEYLTSKRQPYLTTLRAFRPSPVRTHRAGRRAQCICRATHHDPTPERCLSETWRSARGMQGGE